MLIFDDFYLLEGSLRTSEFTAARLSTSSYCDGS